MGEFNADDIIAGILGFMGSREESTRIIGDWPVIMKAVREIRNKYPLLREFAFQDDYVCPWSPLLERVLMRLCVAMILKPWDGYVVSEKAKGIIQSRTYSRFSASQLDELRQIAKELESSILAPPEE